ncbi:hypothetical protein [Microbulbifer rhizosphaerae]|uniref:Uncharacterized protein n=1 Tax=Microbulbifer rhizosphaerae TaxID=1562603 RepID=A0A7W4WCF8_9GAMM|nr:hypothetical protein [Microbulbifer rhizosphaerae]MBB3061696.1 hypothetical protein [Microbulbifer rhizosphaerae]
MQDFRSWREHPRLGGLQALFEGLLEFLFLDALPFGNGQALSAYKTPLIKAEYGWLYEVMELYCLLNHPQLQAGDPAPLIAWTDHSSGPPFQASLELVRHLLGVPGHDGELTKYLAAYLHQPRSNPLVSALSRFFKLKRPKPTQKTVLALEQALAGEDWFHQTPWQDAIKHLVLLFIQRNPGMQLTPEQWARLPALGQLLGKVEREGRPGGAIDLDGAGTALLQQIHKATQKASLDFASRLQYELLRCRLLSRYLDDDPDGTREFENQLNSLFRLCCTGVPPNQKSTARACLETLVEWLCQGIQQRRLPLIHGRLLRLPCSQYPGNYRLALLNFLAGTAFAGSGTHKREAATDFYQVDPGLFYFALTRIAKPDKFLAHFYWPLGGEDKKRLAAYVLREILCNADADTDTLWHKLQNSLFDSSREPLANVIAGQAVEAEWLFYAALVTLEQKRAASAWIKPEHIDLLLRQSSHWLRQSDNRWLRKRVCQLFNRLCQVQGAEQMLARLESICGLLQQIRFDPDIEQNLKMLLQHLIDRREQSPFAREFHTLCRVYPRLRKLAPKPVPEKRPMPDKKRQKETDRSPNLELFGEIDG